MGLTAFCKSDFIAPMFLKIFSLLIFFWGSLGAKALRVDVGGDWAPFTGGFFNGDRGDLRGCLSYANKKLDDYEIEFDLDDRKISLFADLPVLNLHKGNHLKIDGANLRGGRIVIDGRGAARGFVAFQGTVEISNLVLLDTFEKGKSYGRGLLGAGGALFIREPASVQLHNVEIYGSRAVGGNGTFGIEEPELKTVKRAWGDPTAGLNDLGWGGSWSDPAGTGGGNGSWCGCGGGAGLGGGIFVMSGAKLSMSGSGKIEGGAAIAGLPGVGSASAGAAVGAGIFIQSSPADSTQVVFAPESGKTIAVFDSIGDESGISFEVGRIGSSVLIDGPGKVVFKGDHIYSGLTEVKKGTLEFEGTVSGPLEIGLEGRVEGTGNILGPVRVLGALAPSSLKAKSILFGNNSEFEVHIDENGASKLVLKEGAAIAEGAILRIHVEGACRPGSVYSILGTEEGGISGRFEVQSPAGYLFEAELDPTLSVLNIQLKVRP